MSQETRGSKLVELIALLEEYGIRERFLMMLVLMRSGRDIEEWMVNMPEKERLLPKHGALMRGALQELLGKSDKRRGDLNGAAVGLILRATPAPNLCRYYRNALDKDRESAPQLVWPDTTIPVFMDRYGAEDFRPDARQIGFRATLCGLNCTMSMTVRHRRELVGPKSSSRSRLCEAMDVHLKIRIKHDDLSEPVVRRLYNEVVKPTKPYTDSRHDKAVVNVWLELGYLLPVNDILKHLELVSTKMRNDYVYSAYFQTDVTGLAAAVQHELCVLNVPIENVAVIEY